MAIVYLYSYQIIVTISDELGLRKQGGVGAVNSNSTLLEVDCQVRCSLSTELQEQTVVFKGAH